MRLTFTDLVFLGAIRDYQRLKVSPPGAFTLFNAGTLTPRHDKYTSWVNQWLSIMEVERWKQMPITSNDVAYWTLRKLRDNGYITENNKLTPKGSKLLASLPTDPNQWAEEAKGDSG